MPVIRLLLELGVPAVGEGDRIGRRPQVEDSGVERGAKGVARVVPAEPDAGRVEPARLAVLVLVGLAREAVGGDTHVDHVAVRQRVKPRLRVRRPHCVDVRHEDGATQLQELVEGGHLHRAHASEARLVGANPTEVGRVAKVSVVKYGHA